MLGLSRPINHSATSRSDIVAAQRLAGDRAAPLPLRVVITPVRGYERDGRRRAAMLDDAMRTMGDVDTAATAAMVAAGHRPGEPMVASLTLNPAAPVRASLAAVLRRWSDVIDANRAGVLDDIDIEYLHELRTAVRGTRSLLSLHGRSAQDVAPRPRRAAAHRTQ